MNDNSIDQDNSGTEKGKDTGSISKKDDDNIIYLMEIENDSIISRRSLINDLDVISSGSVKESLLEAYERDLKELEMGIHWKEEESRMISQLMLKSVRSRS